MCCVTLHVSVIRLTIFRGCSLYNAAFRLVASSLFYLGMCTVHNKTDSREVHMTTTQIEDMATYPTKIVTKQQGGKQHCTRNIPWRWSGVWPKHEGWHNRRRHSNVLKSDCVLMCILKHSAWAGFLNNVLNTILYFIVRPFNAILFSFAISERHATGLWPIPCAN